MKLKNNQTLLRTSLGQFILESIQKEMQAQDRNAPIRIKATLHPAPLIKKSKNRFVQSPPLLIYDHLVNKQSPYRLYLTNVSSMRFKQN